MKDWAALVNTLVESGCTWTAQVQVVENKNKQTTSNILSFASPPPTLDVLPLI